MVRELSRSLALHHRTVIIRRRDDQLVFRGSEWSMTGLSYGRLQVSNTVALGLRCNIRLDGHGTAPLLEGGGQSRFMVGPDGFHHVEHDLVPVLAVEGEVVLGGRETPVAALSCRVFDVSRARMSLVGQAAEAPPLVEDLEEECEPLPRQEHLDAFLRVQCSEAGHLIGLCDLVDASQRRIPGRLV